MNNRSWQKIESIFHSALELESDARENYLRRACKGNEVLRREVVSLLSAFDEKSEFMKEPVFDLGMKVLEKNGAKSLSGQKVSFYKIGEKIGSGGMGDVYLAEDTRLNRKVALKFLSNSLVGDDWGKKQLVREAQAIAMLDHPNICTIHGIEKVGKFQFIVMQYVEGETLSRLISQKVIKPEQILPITQQIVEALAAAHSRGIVHRDIKPGNIMITPNGQVKVLDFGLAKIIRRNEKTEKLNGGNTQNSQKGLILGTVAYMSPEQLKAEELDYRSDIFSLGTLLAELTSFKHPFACESDAETISAILTGEWHYQADKNLKLPAGFNRIIKVCLEKDKLKRFQSAEELLVEMQNLTGREPRVKFHTLYFRSILAFLFLLSIFFGIFIYQKTSRVRTLAVFPFINETTAGEFEYSSSSMTEDFINRLSVSDKLQVKDFSVVSSYKTNEIDPVKTGRELNVDAVLVGKISHSGNQLVLQIRLLDTKDGAEILKVDNSLRDSELLSSQSDITRRIIKGLQPLGSIFTAEKSSPKELTNDPAAFNLYLKRRYFLQRRDKENVQKAIGFFNQAIEYDPAYANAYTGLADSYVFLSQVSYGSTDLREVADKARAAAKQALQIDGSSCELHTSLGVILLKLDWNLAEAEKEFKRALEINPAHAPAYYWYSTLLLLNGRADEAMEKAESFKKLDPFSQLSKINIARIYYLTKRYDEALQVLTAKDETVENNSKTQYMLGLVYLQKEMYQEAEQIFQNIYAADKSLGGAMLIYCYGKMGKKEEAQQTFAEIEETQTYFPPPEKVFVYIGLKEKKKALSFLRESVNARYTTLLSLKIEPLYKDLYSEPEFAEIVKQMPF